MSMVRPSWSATLTAMAKIAPYVSLLFGLVLAALAVPDAIEGLQIASKVDDYRSTRAEVMRQTTRKPARGPEVDVLEFRYEVDGRTYEGDNHWTQADDDPALFQRLIRREKDTTKTILIYYDPDNPGNSVIRRDIPVWFHVGVIALTAFLIFGSIMSFVTERKKRAMIERNKPRRNQSDDV